MAQETPFTSAKQLLDLIEDPKTKDASIRAQAVRHNTMRLISPGMWKSKFSFFRDNFKKGIKEGFRQPDLKTVNNGLIVIIVIIAFYLMNTLYFSISNFTKNPGQRFALKEGLKRSGVPRDVLAGIPPTAYYLDKIRQRDIFKSGPKKIVKEAGPAVSSSKTAEATEHLKLAGISWSNDPDAMIEDTKALRTFFVKRGQMIGEVKVEAIFKDKVIVSYEGQEAELK